MVFVFHVCSDSKESKQLCNHSNCIFCPFFLTKSNYSIKVILMLQQPMLHWWYYVCLAHDSFCPIFHPIFCLCCTKCGFCRFQWNSWEVIEQIKWIYFGRKWNGNKGAEYERKFKSTSIGFIVMSNRCWCWVNEFTNFTKHTMADAIVDNFTLIWRFHLHISYKYIKNCTSFFHS